MESACIRQEEQKELLIPTHDERGCDVCVFCRPRELGAKPRLLETLETRREKGESLVSGFRVKSV